MPAAWVADAHTNFSRPLVVWDHVFKLNEDMDTVEDSRKVKVLTHAWGTGCNSTFLASVVDAWTTL